MVILLPLKLRYRYSHSGSTFCTMTHRVLGFPTSFRTIFLTRYGVAQRGHSSLTLFLELYFQLLLSAAVVLQLLAGVKISVEDEAR